MWPLWVEVLGVCFGEVPESLFPGKLISNTRILALLEEHYDAMVAYMDYLETTIDKETGITSDGALGDWLGPQNNQLGTPS